MRLIDADDFLTQIAKRLEYIEQRREHLAKHLHFFMMDGAIAGELRRTIETIKNAPTIDAAPVVHARWEETNCTACGESYMEYAEGCSFPAYCENKLYTPDFCPHCGAKMDTKEDES